MDKFDAARDIIETRWPKTWNAIADSELHHHFDVVREAPEQTLVFSGIHLTSSYNRMSEAHVQARLIDSESEKATIYGFGLGDLPRVLLERQNLKSLHVVVLNPSIVRTVLQHFDQTDWLQDPRVTLVLARNAKKIEKPFAVCPASLRLASDEAVRIRDRIVQELERNFKQHQAHSKEKEFDDRLKAALPLMRMDGDVASLFGGAPGKIGVVVAGGPTAAEMFPWIRKHRGQLSVIAVSTALLPLQKNSISPDVLIAVDPNPDLESHFFDADLNSVDHVPFVYVPVVCKKVLEWWKGPRLVAYLHQPRYEELAANLPRGFLFYSGTVTHAAVDLSLKMGNQKVILVGVDFCFPDSTNHPQGANQSHAPSKRTYVHPYIVNGNGERVMSSTAMIGHLRELELYIESHQRIEFFNTGRMGSEIIGAPWLEGKALDDFCS